MDKLFLLRGLVSAIYDLAYSGAWGVLLAGMWLGHPSSWRLRLIRLLRTLVLLVLCMLSAQAWLLTASMSGESAFMAVCGMVRQAVLETQPGHAWCAQLLVALLIVTETLVVRELTRRASFVLMVTLALLAAFRAASGHAASYGNFTVQEGCQWVHLVCTAVWSGGILISGLFIVGRRWSPSLTTKEYGRKLSRWVTLALAGVILTGIYNAYLGLGGTVAPLTHSQWGVTLIVKSVLVLFALALGGWNRYLLGRGDWNEDHEKGFIRGLRIEAVVMILILVVSAWLANSPPAAEM